MNDYVYFYEHGEANFGPPLQHEVSGGSHLTIECLLQRDRTLYALRLPDGLHGCTKNALYFAHGLIRFGEKLPECVKRLVADQAGVDVTAVQPYTLSTWVDDNNHWHMCLNVFATIANPPLPSARVSEVVPFTAAAVPLDLEWWTPEEMVSIFRLLDRLTATE
jgi:hypothetical protein